MHCLGNWPTFFYNNSVSGLKFALANLCWVSFVHLKSFQVFWVGFCRLDLDHHGFMHFYGIYNPNQMSL